MKKAQPCLASETRLSDCQTDGLTNFQTLGLPNWLAGLLYLSWSFIVWSLVSHNTCFQFFLFRTKQQWLFKLFYCIRSVFSIKHNKILKLKIYCFAFMLKYSFIAFAASLCIFLGLQNLFPFKARNFRRYFHLLLSQKIEK